MDYVIQKGSFFGCNIKITANEDVWGVLSIHYIVGFMLQCR
jgi:hypothetical protein